MLVFQKEAAWPTKLTFFLTRLTLFPQRKNSLSPHSVGGLGENSGRSSGGSALLVGVSGESTAHSGAVEQRGESRPLVEVFLGGFEGWFLKGLEGFGVQCLGVGFVGFGV